MKQIRPIAFIAALFLSLLCQAQEMIRISTSDHEMVMAAYNAGPVHFVYWGEKVQGDAFPFQPGKNQPDTQDDITPRIYPSYGGRHYLTPALRLTHSDGVLTTDLVYAGHTVSVLDENRKETVISLKDRIYPVTVSVRYLAYQKENVVAQSVTLSHSEPSHVVVESIASSFIPFHADSYWLTHFNGTWAHEMQLEEERLTHGQKVIESKKGVRATQSENPSFILSLDGPLAEDSGEVYAGALAWSGNYRLVFELDETGRLGVTSGINPFASELILEPGKCLETPQMILSYSPSGAGQLSRNMHDWARRYGMTHGDVLHPVLLNSWEGAYFTFDEKTITDMIDKAASAGVEMFVLDDGWFGNRYPRNGDNAGLGDWQVNRKKLPRGIDHLADHAVSKGMKFGIWIEPEMVNPDSDLAHKHPEWIVRSGEREVLTMRNQWLLDLTNPEVQDFIVKTFDEVLGQSDNISYVKWDANRHVDNVGSTYLPADRQSHFWYEYVRGLYDVYERIRAKHPDIMIQLCSSGGGRLDYGALKYHDEFWASDNTNALDRIYIQHSTNLLFPAIATGSHVSTSPNHQTGMLIPLKFRFDVAMGGRLGLELQPSSLVGEEYDFACKAITVYKDFVRPLVQLGDLYRLESPYSGTGWSSHMHVAKDKSEAVMFAYCMKYNGRTTYFSTRLKGLEPESVYKVEEINEGSVPAFPAGTMTCTGDYLMKVGLQLRINKPFSSCILKFSKIQCSDSQ